MALGLQKHGVELLGPLTPYFVMKVGHVPVINDYRPGDPEAALEVASTITRYDERVAQIRAAQIEGLQQTCGAVW